MDRPADWIINEACYRCTAFLELRRLAVALLCAASLVTITLTASVEAASEGNQVSPEQTGSDVVNRDNFGPTLKPVEYLSPHFQAYRERRQAIGSLLVMGFEGKDAKGSFFQRFQQQISAGHVGAVLFLGHNIPSKAETLNDMVRELRAAATERPILLAVDQEGGRVARLKPWHGVDEVPSHKDVGKLSLDEAERRYRALACQLRAVGFDWNFGPVVDVNINPNNPVIGRLKRAFSADADHVISRASRFVAAHHDCGIATSLKHFPGHGSATVDSHKGLPDVTRVWRPSEMVPFREMIANGAVDSIMVGHLFHNLVDDDLPTSLSPKWISGYLRGRLGYEGVVITDDLDMRAIADRFSPAEAVVQALTAGSDMVIVGGGARPYPELAQDIIAAVLNAVENADHPLTWERIEASVTRVRAMQSARTPVRP